MRNITRYAVGAMAALAMLPVGATVGAGISSARPQLEINEIQDVGFGIDILIDNTTSKRGRYCLAMAREPGTGPNWFHHAFFSIEDHGRSRATIIGIDKAKHWEIKLACDGNNLQGPVVPWN